VNCFSFLSNGLKVQEVIKSLPFQLDKVWSDSREPLHYWASMTTYLLFSVIGTHMAPTFFD